MLRGMGRMYIDDPRFAATYDAVEPGMSRFVAEAVAVSCDNAEDRSADRG